MIKPGDEPIPGYRIEKFLGQGRFGQVWRATAPGNTLVALKFIELSGLHGWKEFRAIQRVKQIRHAHLMPIVALWLLDSEGNIVSDRVVDDLASHESTQAILSTQGMVSTETLVADPNEQLGKPSLMVVANLLASHSLFDRLKAAQDEGLPGIPREELLGYVTEAAKALDFLNMSQHEIGDSTGSIQHCDVKPDNILLIGGSVVLADWGVAQLLAGQQTSVTATSLGGTPAYMPPECFNNTPCHTSDQYSLAVTYYQLRTGHLPFLEETYAAVFAAHRDESLDFSMVNANEQRVLRRATAKDPGNRFATSSDFVAALHDPPVAATPTRSTRRRLPWAAIIVGAVLPLALLGLDRWWPKEEAPTARIVIDVKPADATLLINEEPTALDETGKVTLEEIPWGQLLKVTASKPGERSSVTMEIDPQHAEEQRSIELPYSATHHAEKADELLKKNDFDGAVESLAKAIQKDPTTYARIPAPQLGFMAAEDDSIVALKFSPDERWLLVGTKGGLLRSFFVGTAQLSDGTAVHQLAARIKKLEVHQKWAAAISNQGDKIWLAPSHSLSDGVELTLPENAGRIVDFVIPGDGRWLVAAAEDYLLSDGDELMEHAMSSIYAWDLQAKDIGATCLESFNWDKEIEATLTASHAEPWFVIATYATALDSCVVRQCWVESKQERRLYKERGEQRKVAVGKNDRLVAIGGQRNDTVTGEQGIIVLDVNAPAETIELPWGHASLAQLAWDSAGGHLASSDHDGEMHVWQIPEDFIVKQQIPAAPVFLHVSNREGDPLRRLAQDGLRCFASGWLLCQYSSGETTLWDSSQERPQPMPLSLSLGPISAIAVSEGGKWIAVGGYSKVGAIGEIGVWSGERLRLIKRACERAGVESKSTQPSLPDRVTNRYLPNRRFPWGRIEIVSLSSRRPSAKPA